MTYKNSVKWKKKPKGGTISTQQEVSDWIQAYLSPGYAILDETHLWKGDGMTYEHKDWMELPADTPYKNGYTIKVPAIPKAIFSMDATDLFPKDVTMETTTYTVIPPPHEMKVQTIRIYQDHDGGPWPYARVELDVGATGGPYHLDLAIVRGVWFTKPEPIEVEPGLMMDGGLITVWWLCNGSLCCGGDDQPVSHSKLGPTFKEVQERPMLAVNKVPVPSSVLWGVPEKADVKKARLLEESDAEVRRLAQQILEDASDVLLVDGWIKGSYHRLNDQKRSITSGP